MIALASSLRDWNQVPCMKTKRWCSLYLLSSHFFGHIPIEILCLHVQVIQQFVFRMCRYLRCKVDWEKLIEIWKLGKMIIIIVRQLQLHQIKDGRFITKILRHKITWKDKTFFILGPWLPRASMALPIYSPILLARFSGSISPHPKSSLTPPAIQRKRFRTSGSSKKLEIFWLRAFHWYTDKTKKITAVLHQPSSLFW